MYLPEGGGCTCQRGVYLPEGGVPAWGVYLPGGCTYLGGVPAWGVYLPGGVTCPGGVPGRGCTYWGCTWSNTSPPVNRMTDTCKNITLAKTSFRPVNIG